MGHRVHLHALAAEQQGATDELAALHEEMVAAHEELQSNNEELEGDPPHGRGRRVIRATPRAPAG